MYGPGYPCWIDTHGHHRARADGDREARRFRTTDRVLCLRRCNYWLCGARRKSRSDGWRRLDHNADICRNAGCSRHEGISLGRIGRHNARLTRRRDAHRRRDPQAWLDRESVVDTGDNWLPDRPQLPGIFGIAKGAGDLVGQVLVIATNLSKLNPFSSAIGLGVFATMLLAERISARIPGALIGIALAALAVLTFDLESRGVAVLGALPGGLPGPALPTSDLLRQLTPLALIVTLVIMMQTATVTYSFRNSAEPEPDIDRDFLGLGAGNLVAALLGAFPVDASPPRTAVVVGSGSRSQLSALVAAIIVLALVLWGRGLLYHVPEAALAGVLLFVAQRLVRVGTIVTIAQQAPVEALLILLTAAAIIILPIQIGVTIGIGLSLLYGLSKTIRTRPIELRKLPGTTVWWPPEIPGQGERQEGVAVIAFQAPLLFANAEIFKRGMIETIDSYDRPLSLVVLEASGIADVDFTAAQAFIEILDHCRTANIRFALARLESTRAHEAFNRFGVLDALGPDRLFHSVDEAVNRLARQQ